MNQNFLMFCVPRSNFFFSKMPTLIFDILPVPEFIDPVFTKTSPKGSFSLNRKRAFWLVSAKTGSIISGTVLYMFCYCCYVLMLLHSFTLLFFSVSFGGCGVQFFFFHLSSVISWQGKIYVYWYRGVTVLLPGWVIWK
jgi:hypothetical protein